MNICDSSCITINLPHSRDNRPAQCSLAPSPTRPHRPGEACSISSLTGMTSAPMVGLFATGNITYDTSSNSFSFCYVHFVLIHK